MLPIRPPFGRVRTVQVVGLLITILIFVSLRRASQRQPQPNIYRYTDDQPPRPIPVEAAPVGPSEEAVYLRQLVARHGLSNDVPWFARRIRPSAGSSPRGSVTDVSAKFLSRDFVRVRADDERLRLTAERATKLAVSRSATPESIDASRLLVGISTTHSRLVYANHSLEHEWRRWLTDGRGRSNGATLVLTLQHASAVELRSAGQRLAAMGIDAHVMPLGAGVDLAASYLDLVRILASRRTDAKTHLALLEDDVFLPNLGELLRRLEEGYDPTKEFYVGAPAERADWVIDHNETVTYGGGAVFLTPPAAEAILRLPCAAARQQGGDEENDEDADARTKPMQKDPSQWDLRLFECVARHRPSLKMHVLPSLYTPAEERFGLQPQDYASGARPLVLHHHRSRHRFEAGRAHLVASACGEACFLQRFRFRDDWILVNGFSLTQYLDGVDVPALADGYARETKTQKLIQPVHRDAERTGPVSARLVVDDGEEERDGVSAISAAVRGRRVVTWAGRKRTWRFLDGHVSKEGEVWQAYVRRRGRTDGGEEGDERLASDVVHAEEEVVDVDSVVVLIWEP